jgi:uncharacterized integral membrane protein
VWLLRSILAFAGLGLVMMFAVSNIDQRVDVVLFTRTYHDVYLNLVLLCAGLAGALLCFAVMIIREFALRTTLRRMRRENMRLDGELVALRNLPLAGVLPSDRPRPPRADR